MKLLKNKPIIFVHYPKGASGWFLASLLHQGFDPTASLLVDKNGGTNHNLEIQQTNNFLYLLSTDTGKILTTTIDLIPDDIIFLQRSAEYFDEKLECHVISIHCANINVFLKAFPNSKCIQLIVEPQYKLYCLYNWLTKIISHSDKSFIDLCNEYGKDPETLKDVFDNLTMENVQAFEFAMDKVNLTAKQVPNDMHFDDRILEIDYVDFMTDDADFLSTAILNFVHGTYSDKLYDNFVKNIINYRFSQKIKLVR